MSLAAREELTRLFAQDPMVLAAYVLEERRSSPQHRHPQTTATSSGWPLQLGVLFRIPGTRRSPDPRDKTARRLALAKKAAELLDTPVEVLDLDNASQHERLRAIEGGLVLYVRPGGEPAQRSFEAFVHDEKYRKRLPFPERLRKSTSRHGE